MGIPQTANRAGAIIRTTKQDMVAGTYADQINSFANWWNSSSSTRDSR